MPTIHPFPALLPIANRAAQVASEPYDVVSNDEARSVCRDQPLSFMHVVRPDADLPPDADPHGDAAHRQARAALDRLVGEGVLRRAERPWLYVYRLAGHGHRQVGLVACCTVSEYDSGVIRRHERTRPDKEADRTSHLLAADAHTEPVILAHRDDEEIEELLRADANDRPIFHFVAPDGVTHSAWAVRDPAPYLDRFAALGPAWIADGHHRCAAASRAAHALEPARGTEGEHEHFLAALFPAGQLRILPYNRAVRDLGGLDARSFLDRLRGVGRLEPANDATPSGPGEVRVRLDGRWWSLTLPPGSGNDPVAALDVDRLFRHVLQPVLGIDDERTSDRISFVGGVRSGAALEQAVESGAAATAFSMHPTSIADMMRIADAGGVMPPKSTWFEPKLRSGLFVHPFA